MSDGSGTETLGVSTWDAGHGSFESEGRRGGKATCIWASVAPDL